MLVIYMSWWWPVLVVCPVRIALDDPFDGSAKLKLARAEVCRKLEARASARNQTSSVTYMEDFGQVRTITPGLDMPNLKTPRNRMAKGHESDGGVGVTKVDETTQDDYQHPPPYEPPYLPLYEEVETGKTLSKC